MTTISQLEHTIGDLELAELAHTRVSAHAVVQTIDPHTLVVVVFCGHNTEIVEQAIRRQHYDAKEITATNDIITIHI